jgi:hypothetical protein
LHELDIDQLEPMVCDEVQTHVDLEQQPRQAEAAVSRMQALPRIFPIHTEGEEKALTRGSSREARSRVSKQSRGMAEYSSFWRTT